MTRTADLDRSGSKVANISGGEAESVETGSIVSYCTGSGVKSAGRAGTGDTFLKRAWSSAAKEKLQGRELFWR